jgi:hypothetical protein
MPIDARPNPAKQHPPCQSQDKGASPVGLALARACFQTFTEQMKMPPPKGISSGTKFAKFGQDCAFVLFADELDFVSAARQYYDLRNRGAIR